METKRCIICASPAKGKLCVRCSKTYIYEKSLSGARLRKIIRNARIRKKHNWKSEKRLYRILRKFYRDTFRDFRPEWSLSPKNVALEYDICIPEKKILIEIDGPYHWNRELYSNDEDFKYRQLCDHLKEENAIRNGWQFYRIDLETTFITKRYIIDLLGIRPRARFFKFRRI